MSMRMARLLTASALVMCPGSAIHVELASTRPPAGAQSELLDQALALEKLDQLWSGSDDAPAHQKPGRPGAKGAARGSPPKWARLQVVGHFDSGTNLLTSLLHANLPEEVVDHACPVLKKGIDSCLFWKHVPPVALPSEVSAMFVDGWLTNSAGGVATAPKAWPPKDPERNVVLVAMVRSPMGFMHGMNKAPYDLRHCVTRGGNWVNYTDKICHLRKLVDTHEDGHLYEYHGRFAGLAGVWNDYMHAYHWMQLKAEADPKLTVLVVEYENLVFDPERVVRQIASAMGTDLKGPFEGLDYAAKSHGSAHGRRQALGSIEQMSYLNSWKFPMKPLEHKGARERLCAYLDRGLMQAHEFNTSSGTRSYLADCDFER